MPEEPLPTEEQVRGYLEACSNWGRWGPDDSAGTVNHVTPEKRREAAALVKTGRAVSISYPLNTVGGPGNWNPAQHFVRSLPDFSVDYIGLLFHGYATTHVDALCHIFWEGKMYNGKPATDVTPLGARSGSVDAWKTGITTRGVLIDIPRFRGEPYVTLERPVRAWEIEDAALAQGTPLRPGDAVLVYSGRPAYFAANPAAVPGVAPSPGLHADTAPYLKGKDAAILGWDQMDAAPSGYRIFPGLSVHVLTIVFMGMPLLDNAFLEPLAQACEEEGRWEFLLTINPLHVRGGTGSPVNPVAIF
ncbi:MAG: cyclase family protein [Dehalococcoidia bacterium]|jgi:kynurenine formamidase|uniref:cyclase family protein n=1 Tax=Candidatus Amarobacter glycogenicus TaxID=3140699 RepID=UPI001DED2B98|nr:cyclase family protein [Dehalococcoidia bacterium]MBK6562490.1 cyclase family protein [Dehalococcoidia bacterium]MBK7124320.1 cyclase family protein [Dehalococcoidia bacterium]MBK7724006.1 cyclase family protein [Dehalococcoidia bacterium]MBK8560675.1 cyclase family protein [Dehalococcoidia bacterium]